MGTNSERLLKTAIRVANPNEDTLTVCVEPWASRYELAFRESLDITFIGSRVGLPEISAASNCVSVYGWEGSIFMAFQNGRVAGRQPTISEIVSQELQLDIQVVRTQVHLPVNWMETAQRFLDEVPYLGPASQQLAMELAAPLIVDLADCLAPSDEARQLLGRIADRVLQLRGRILPEPDMSKLDPWNQGPQELIEFIYAHSVSMLPFDPLPTHLSEPRHLMPQPGWESAKTHPQS